jgi:hypothetical protein
MAEQPNRNSDVWSSRVKVAFLVFAAIGAFLLIAEHRAHVVPFLPWLFLAACPLMHLFMHGDHGGHGGPASHDRPEESSNRTTGPEGSADHGPAGGVHGHQHTGRER